MKEEIKIDAKGIINYLMTRRILLKNSNELIFLNIRLIWLLVVMFFFSGFIILAAIICLLFGCNISIADSSQDNNNHS